MELSSVPTDAELLALAGEVAAEVQRCRLMLLTAESGSGGWIAKTLTDLPGSSAWFDAGVVTYSYEAKEALLGVNPRTLEHTGAVSEETVLEMVSGALARFGAGVAVAVTGIAGPSGKSRSVRSGSAGSAVAAMAMRSSSIFRATARRCAGRPWRRRSSVCVER